MKNESIAWDNIAEMYDESFGDEGDYSHKYIIYPGIKNILGNISGKKIIDLGCGTGTLSRSLYKNGAEVTGIDFSDKMLELALLRNRNIKYIKENLNENLSFEDEIFDISLSVMVLHSLSFIDKCISESFRTLKHKGRFIVVVPHMAHIYQFRSVILEDNSKYLTEQRAMFKWKQFKNYCKLPTAFYLRPLQFYFDAFRKHGFAVNAIIEPSIVDKAKDDIDNVHTMEIWQRLKEKPSFMIFDCFKE